MLTILVPPVLAADPARGAQLFAQPPQAGLLGCADCHSEDPIVNNFGNIWSGRNALSLIERAVQSNTGGMGYLAAFYSRSDLADIAAYLGQSQTRLDFAPTAIGQQSAPLHLTISSSVKLGLQGLSLVAEGDYSIVGATCGTSLPAFASCSVSLVFRPTGDGHRPGVLLLDHTGTPTPVRVTLAGEGQDRPPAVASLSPDRLQFPPAPGASGGSRRNAVLANHSTQPLRLQAVTTTAAAFVRAGGTCTAGLTLAPGERCLVALRHDSDRSAQARAELRIEHDGVGQVSVVELETIGLASTARGPRPDREGIDFGRVPMATRTATQLLTLSNIGDVPVAWREMVTRDASFDLVATTCPSPAVLQPRQRCQLALSFASSRAGRHSSELTLRDAQGLTLLRLPLSATVGTGGGLVATTGRLMLRAEVGQGSGHALVIQNRASAAVTLPEIQLSGPATADFSVSAGSCGAGMLLPAGTSCWVDIRFAPTAAGERTARLQAGALGVDLVGRGPDGQTAVPWLDQALLDFGQRPVATAGSTRSVTVHNRGPTAWSWRALAVAGGDAADFPLAGDCTPERALAPGASCRAEVAFIPGAPGLRTASLVLWPQGQAEPGVVSLLGQGVLVSQAALVADRIALDFGPQPMTGFAATRRLHLHNVGSGDAAPPVLTIDGPFAVAAVDPRCLAVLPAGASCWVDLRPVDGPPAPARGRLSVQSAGSSPLVVQLAAQRTDGPAVLVWSAAAAPQPGITVPVGQASVLPAAGSWELMNRGSAPTAPLRWLISGEAADDYSLAADSSCRDGSVLAPGQSCTVRLNFHPTAAGLRTARLSLGDGTAVDDRVLQGHALAAAEARLQTWPSALTFEARIGASPDDLPLVLHNAGPAAAALATLTIDPAAFGFVADPTSPCAAEVADLLPGERCLFLVAWNGSAAALPGGRFTVGTRTAPLAVTVPLAVVEDPGQRSNVGTGGGAWSPMGLLLLAVAVVCLYRLRPESPHA